MILPRHLKGPSMPLTARDIMTPSVKAVPHSWTMQQLSRFLTDNELAGSPVADDADTIVGIVTLKDIVEFQWNAVPRLHEEHLDPKEKAEARWLRRCMLQEMSRSPVEVRDIMTPHTTTVPVDTDVTAVANTMMKEHLHRIFVTLGSAVVGIITTYDMLRVIADPALSARCLERHNDLDYKK